ncbi:MAG TPA: PqqD family protein [Bacteriovoracaceae bacterium]|nr:PqqD family protein [Bacteriovoracaceae bacterium]
MIKPLRMERLAYKTIGDEAIILDTKIGREVHQLNEVATVVWNLCNGTHDIQSMVEKVCTEFEVEPAVAERDIKALLAEFNSKSLLR